MAAGALPYDVLSAYDRLFESLGKATEDDNVGVVKSTGNPSAHFRVDPIDSARALLDIQLHLKEWKARGNTISILIHAREAIERSTRRLIRSTVHVSYYRLKGNAASLLHNMHFDFDGEQDNHPVFHAQLCSDDVVLSSEAKQQLSFRYTRDNSKPTCYRDARIPTSDMTFASVLLCLAADHLVNRASFKDVYDSVCNCQEQMPIAAFTKMKASIASNSKHLGSSHWFAHMF